MNNIMKKAVGKVLPKIWSGIFLLAFIFIAVSELSAQNYEFTLNQRRMGDTIGVEVWVKSLNGTAASLGDMSIPIVYDHTYLTPANLGATNPRSWTDSISYDMELAQPYQTINSPYADALYGFTSLAGQAITGTNGASTLYAFILDVKTVAGSPTGFTPASTGKGSYVGMLKFYISDNTNLTEGANTGIAFNNANWLAVKAITDVNGNDVTSVSTFTDPASFTIRGITVLNPNYPNQAVNRYPDAAYPSLSPNLGYPLYFERSGLAGNLSDYSTNKVAYKIEYSLDNGSTWSEIGKVAEYNADVLLNTSYYVTGDIDTKSAVTPRYLTTYDNSLLSTNNSGALLRTIWKADQNFAYRSEQARLRVVQIDTSASTLAATIVNRDAYSTTTTNRWDINNYSFVLGRLFFVQLDGSSTYLKTDRTFSNSTVLTVAAWVNLNSMQAVGSEPAVVASSAGSISPQEGAWMLYLKDGRYPAFRVREIEGRGPGGYIGTVVSSTALSTTSDASPISNAHSSNWVHLAAVVDNNVVKLYVNGEEVDRYTNNQAVNIRMMTSNHPIWVGLNPNGTVDATDYVHAGIKDVQVWRSALDQDQIREHIAGIYNPTDISDLTNERVKLELYYPLQGFRSDRASEEYYQNDVTWLSFYNNPSVTATNANASINYRPDRPHISLTSPTGNEGVVNLKDEVFKVRWVAYGLGSTSPASKDLMIQLSRDGGLTWFDAIDNDIPSLPLDQVEVEDGEANWEPYNNATFFGQNDDLQGIIDVPNNYSKNVLLKISGTDTNNQDAISDTSASFVVAPYFAYRNTATAVVKVAGNINQNITSSSPFMLEAWIRPHRFPTVEEGSFPIVSKKADDNSGNLAYAFRLLPTGQLQFELQSSTGLLLRTATSSADNDSLVTIPNVIENDTAWTHVAVFVNPGSAGASSVIFYIDGTPQFTSGQTGQLGDNITVDRNNLYPFFIGHEPGLAADDFTTFLGDIKEVRVWNGYPANQTTAADGNTSNLTYFVQGAQSVKAEELGVFNGNDFADNLVSAYQLDGGSWVNNGIEKSIAVYPANDDLNAKITGTGYAYTAVKPYLKVVNPTFRQKVANTSTNIKVRWVGFAYNRNDVTSFLNGSNMTNDASVEFSVEGGGGQLIQPYQFAASQKYNPAFTNALQLPTLNSVYEFPGTSARSQFAAYLNVSMTDPDMNNDSTFSDQGELASANSNARLRLNARSTINGYTLFHINGTSGEYGYVNNLRPESKLFSITPLSNFTVRVLLEGYHEGSVAGIKSNVGSLAYPEGNALVIDLYKNVSNTPGDLVSSMTSNGYVNNTTAFDVANRNAGDNSFANVPFVFDTITDGRYFVKVTHINHLPIMSRYAAPFLFSGDTATTWAVESGWDFERWNGDSTDVITSSNALLDPPTMGTSYSAYGNVARNTSNPNYPLTSLMYNDGRNGTTTSNQIAAMVGGDVVHDGRINALDRALVEADNGTTNPRSQVKGGSTVVNATDRQIVYRNNGKEADPLLPAGSIAPVAIPGEVSTIVANVNNEELHKYLEAEKSYIRVKNNKNVQHAPKLMAGGISYEVKAMPTVNGEYIDIPMFAKNTGGDFGLGNSTFGITFETDRLQFVEMIKTAKVLFDKDDNLGYFPTFTSPVIGRENAQANLRTIDINFDNYPLANKPGIGLPTNDTYLGTLRFRIIDNATNFNFKWNNATVVYTVDGNNVTADGKFITIPTVNLDAPVSLIFPNGGEQLMAGRPYSITWTNSPVSKLVYIDFSKDAGNTWERITSSAVELKSGSYNWNTPRINSNNCLIAIIDATNGKLIDKSDNVFALTSAPAMITRPSAKDPVYTGGSSDFIRWDIEENVAVKFEFSDNGVSNWKQVSNIIQSNKLEVNWILPTVNTKNAVVRMVNAQTGEVIASSSPFRILAGSLSITSPREGEKLKVGTKKAVRWNYNNVNTFDLQLSLNGGKDWQPINSDVKAAPKSYDWMVVNANTKNAVIRAIYNGDPELEYSRSGEFEISGAVDVEDPALHGYSINSVTPNPFRFEANVKFSIPQSEVVTISLYDMNGQIVATLANNQMFNAGENIITIKGDNLAAGMYMVRINVGMFNLVKEVMHIK
ncbi:MAG TPA: T9SS type A sorting domain-containing protein [Candidatus Kapabacteria bacterium]|nr:T9SS type A sorting domain-containing protein [Candidatus Kapabacteria bacterium]